MFMTIDAIMNFNQWRNEGVKSVIEKVMINCSLVKWIWKRKNKKVQYFELVFIDGGILYSLTNLTNDENNKIYFSP